MSNVFNFDGWDELISSQSERDDSKLAKIQEIPLEKLDEFENHPFYVRENDDLYRLVDSIKNNGVITPAIVRVKDDERYEIISGHRRKRACELAGLETLRCIVVDVERDKAIEMMVESNYQREDMLPSEKANSYRMLFDALKRQGKRSDLMNQVEKHDTAEIIGHDFGESATQVRRYIRLSYLNPTLLKWVDEDTIKLRTGVELSFLDETMQDALVECCSDLEKYPTQIQAKNLRVELKEEMYKDEMIETIISVFCDNKVKVQETLVEVNNEVVESYTEIEPVAEPVNELDEISEDDFDDDKDDLSNEIIKLHANVLYSFFPRGTSLKLMERMILELLSENKERFKGIKSKNKDLER